MKPASASPRPPAESAERDYPLAPAFRARFMGVGLVLLGVVLVVVTVVVAVAGWPLEIMTALVIVAVVFIFGFGAWLGRIRVLALDELGYRVRAVRGVGTPNARWADVHDVATATVGGARCIVLRLRDGSASTIRRTWLPAIPRSWSVRSGVDSTMPRAGVRPEPTRGPAPWWDPISTAQG